MVKIQYRRIVNIVLDVIEVTATILTTIIEAFKERKKDESTKGSKGE